MVGVDISHAHIDNARWATEQLHVPARWYRCDLLDTPSELNGSADLVYTGRGALCWIHDLDGWASVVARLLKPGGVLSLLDDHPASWLFDQDAATIQASSIDYFEYAMTARGWSEQHIGDLGKPQNEHARKHERLWTMSAIFNALVARGLTVVHLGEHPHEYWNAFPKLDRRQKRTLPTTFSMLARKS